MIFLNIIPFSNLHVIHGFVFYSCVLLTLLRRLKTLCCAPLSSFHSLFSSPFT